jgi:DNA-binding CsgD family transcriptional regulator
MGGVSVEDVDALVGRVYDAALQPILWHDVLTRLGDLLGGAALVASALHKTEGIKLAVATRQDPAAFKIVTSVYSGAATNPLVAAMPRLPLASPVALPQVMDPAAYRAHGLFNDVFRPQGLAHQALACLHRTDDVTCPMGILRSTRAGGFSAEEMRLLEVVLPHFGRALRISLRIDALERDARVTREALDRLPVAVLIADCGARLTHANRAAERLLALNDGLTSRRGELGALRGAEANALRKAIARAAAREGCSSSVVSVQRYVVLVAPLGSEQRGALLLVSDPGATPATDREALRQIFQLSAREAELALALLAGTRLKHFADRHSISINTVKSQLRGLFTKTGTARQADLIRLFQSLPKAAS